MKFSAFKKILKLLDITGKILVERHKLMSFNDLDAFIIC